MAFNLFGTDGIRGRLNLSSIDRKEAINVLVRNRELTPELMAMIGESLGMVVTEMPDSKPVVVIGWDDRPGNAKLVDYLTAGLNIAQLEVVQIDCCATPTLHLATLAHNAVFGCMITASHNPVEDSGLKIFNQHGYKTSPEFEYRLSEIVVRLAEQTNRLSDKQLLKQSTAAKHYQSNQWAIPMHRNWLELRTTILFDMLGYESFRRPTNLNNPLYIDSSKGAASLWFADWLSKWGIDSVEVSTQAKALNLNCGAGEISPTDKWTFDEARQSPHMLIQRLPRCEPGLIVAGAFDGDGDRCLLIESTPNGFQVIDGDRIADTIVNSLANAGFEWTMAASIESDLSLSTNLERYARRVGIYETAVGDRWLSLSLSNHLDKKGELIVSNQMPQLLGVEDSGHLVLPAPHPAAMNSWSLVGDGTMTLMAYLLAVDGCDKSTQMKPGWKIRRSVRNVDRTLWDGKNELSDEVESMLKRYLLSHKTINNWERMSVEGEPNLVLINMHYGGKRLSVGIRNSGTQAKISISARLEHGGNNEGLTESIALICQHLSKKMLIH